MIFYFSSRDYLRNHGYRISDDGEMVIVPAIHRHSDSDNHDDSNGSDGDIDTGVTDVEGGGDVCHNVEEENKCNDSEFWD